MKKKLVRFLDDVIMSINETKIAKSWFILIFAANILSISFSELIHGKHLTIATSPFPVALTVERNSSGHIVRMDGISPRMLDWLSLRFNFTFSILQVDRMTTFESSSVSPGLVSCLTNGVKHLTSTAADSYICDLILGGIGTTHTRLVTMDFSQGYLYSNIAFVIPMPDSLNNIAAVVKPFQLPVWIGIICVTSCVFIAFYLIRHIYNENFQLMEREASFELTIWIFGTLLNQGGYCPDRRLFIRLIATSWCLAAFVLVTSYNSLLISYVTSPNVEPLIHSITDLSNISNIHVAVDLNKAIDFILSTARDGNVYKQLGDKLRKDHPKSRCLNPQECIDLVKSDNYVYVATTLAAMDAMEKDFQATGKCGLTLAKEKEPAPPWSWALAKKSPFTEYINRGILEMLANGFLDIWTQWYQPDVRQCLDIADKTMKLKPSSRKDPPRLSLKNLTGAFVVLLVGYLFSFASFITEKIFIVVEQQVSI